jgi:transcriptional regulator with XRE-family HTH domain
MDLDAALRDPDGYVGAFCRAVGEELRARREAAGMSAYKMARLAGVSDQAILNLEQGAVGKNGPCLGTVIRLCVHLRIRVPELVLAAAAAAERKAA